MSASTFIAWHAAMPTTAPMGTVATAASSSTAKTILQLKTGSTNKIRIIEWGYGFDAAPANNVRVELLETGTVGATITQHVTAGIMPWADQAGVSGIDLSSTTATGYNATVEGTITATRVFSSVYENQLYFKQQFPLGREPEIGTGKILRIRATPGSNSAVNMWCYLIWEE